MMMSSIFDDDDNKVKTLAKIGDVQNVTIHPLVLLSATDHYNRIAKGTRKRVVGVLLGTVNKGKVDATNSFAVPFEEDNKNSNVFYLDHIFVENMLRMFKKINSKERLVGFYSTGPQIRNNDVRIYSMLTRFLPKGTITPAVFCIIDVRPNRKSIPTTAYKMIEEYDETKKASRSATNSTNTTTTGTSSSSSGKGKSSSGGNNNTVAELKKNFAHVPSIIGAMEAEEIGVEHLLRDINDPTISTVATLIQGKMAGLASLTDKLAEMKRYLEDCASGKIKKEKINQEIIANMQSILNLLPNLNVEELVKSMMIKTNDSHMVIYLSSLIRSVIALHDLVNNQIRYNEQVGFNLDGVEDNEKDSGTTKKDSKITKIGSLDKDGSKKKKDGENENVNSEEEKKEDDEKK